MPPTNVQFTPPIDSIPSLGDGVLFVFYAIAIIYVVFTAILYYHWQQYSTNKKVTWITYVLYLGTTLPLVIIMGILAFII